MTTPNPTIPSFTDGQFVHQGALNAMAYHVGNLYSRNLGGFRTQLPICTLRVTNQAQSISQGPENQIIWNVADLNTDNMWTSSNPTVMQINTPGLWFLYACIGTTGSMNQLGIRLVVNGLNSQINGIACTSSQSLFGAVSGIAQLQAGALVSTFIYQTNGNPVLLSDSFGSCRMAAFLLAG